MQPTHQQEKTETLTFLQHSAPLTYCGTRIKLCVTWLKSWFILTILLEWQTSDIYNTRYLQFTFQSCAITVGRMTCYEETTSEGTRPSKPGFCSPFSNFKKHFLK